MVRKKFDFFSKLICIFLTISLLITNCYFVETVFAVEDKANLYVSGTEDYNRSFKILEKLNAYRKNEGLTNLKMDKSLVQGAMTRAAENTIYFGITRPDGSKFFSAPEFSNISYEYQDCGKILLSQQTSYSSADSTALQIINDTYFRSLLLNSSIKSMGIGVFNHNNTYYNVIIFSLKDADTYTNPGNKITEKKITAISSLISLKMESVNENINASNKVTMTVYNYDKQVNKYVKINNKSFTWTSSNTKIATVSSSGQVTGVSSGTAIIKGSLPTGQSVSCTVKVSEPYAIPKVENLKQSSNTTSTITLSWKEVSNATG